MTAVAFVQRGLPEAWWDCVGATQNVADRLLHRIVGGKVPITAKDMSRTHQFGKN